MNLLSSASIFSFFTLISRVLGYLRDILIAFFLGASVFADAFFVAFRLPNTFRRLFAEGTFNAAFIPSYTSIKTENKEKGKKFANEVLSLLILILLFIVILSPFFAAMWITLAKRMITPSYGLKCAIGLIIMATGFLVMFFAAQVAASGLKVAPYWLIATYFLHTVGELCLSPVALSAVSKLSPKRFAGQMMGVFVLTYSIGNVVAGLLAGNFDPNKVEDMPNLYLQISLFTISIGIVIFLFTFKTKKWEK